jgi:GNAT superfamily N-acetyltransferase
MEAMGDLTVRAVSTRRERRDFLGFPWKLYRNDPVWVPPLRQNQKELVGYCHHPFFEKNLIQTFLAYRGGEVVGRVAAIINWGHVERFNERRGYFGFFESIDDQEVANGLFDAARAWLAERDFTSIRGPMNPSLNYELGTLIDGFDTPPTFLITYNPPYYQRLIECYGFHKAQDLYSYIGHVGMLDKVSPKLGPIFEQIMERYNVQIRPLDKRNFQKDVEQFLDIYNRSLTRHWGFIPLTGPEVSHMASSLKHLFVPELSLGAIVDGKMVGAVFTLPDYNPRIKAIDGRLFPFGFIRLLWNKHRIKRIRMVSTNVLPEYQLLGIGLLLHGSLVPKVQEWGIEEGEFSWIAESNSLSRGSVEKGGAIRTKTHRVFDFDP